MGGAEGRAAMAVKARGSMRPVRVSVQWQHMHRRWGWSACPWCHVPTICSMPLFGRCQGH